MEKFIAVCLWAVQLLENHTWKNLDFEKDKKKKKKERSILGAGSDSSGFTIITLYIENNTK